MSREFRLAEPADYDGIVTLLMHSFPGFRPPAEARRLLEEDVRGGPESLWVGTVGGEIAAFCRLFRFTQWFAGRSLPVMGLGAVAISPTHRRRGLAADMIGAGFRHSMARGDVATALYPFRTAFYQKLGYGLAGSVHQFVVPPGALPNRPERAGVRLVSTDEEMACVRSVYDRWAPSQSGQMGRSAAAWSIVFEEGRTAVLYRDEASAPQGYAVFRYDVSGPRGARSVHIEEAAWLTPGARAGLIGWMASLGDQWDQVVYRAHPDTPFGDWLSESRFPDPSTPRWHFWFSAATVLRGPMFRLLDLPGAWQRRAVAEGEPITVRLLVDDPHLPDQNGGPWRLRLEEGAAHLEPGAGGACDLEVGIGIEALSRIYAGDLTFGTAIDTHAATADRPERLGALDRRLRIPRPWTFDRF